MSAAAAALELPEADRELLAEALSDAIGVWECQVAHPCADCASSPELMCATCAAAAAQADAYRALSGRLGVDVT